MGDLLGMEDRKGKVPGPLAPGEAPRMVNGVELHNPTWKGRADGTQALVVATVNLIWANQTVSE